MKQTVKITLLFLAAPLLVLGCKPSIKQESAILDVRPARLGMGEKLIVEGWPYRTSSPGAPLVSSAARFRSKLKTRVILEGAFKDAKGHVYQDRFELTGFPVPSIANKNLAERVLVKMSADIKRQLGWARFEGRVGVLQQDVSGSETTLWTAEKAKIRLEFFPPNMRSLARLLTDWVSNDRVLRWLGIEVEVEQDGLRVTSTQNTKKGRGSLAHRVGIEDGDLLVKANNVAVKNEFLLTLAVRKAKRRSVVALTVKRNGEEKTLRVPALRKPVVLPNTVVYLVVMGLFALVIVAISFVIAGLLTWVERRVAARMQYRVGPNRVGPQGVIQWLADGIKLLLKEDVIPDATDRSLFKLAPYLVLMGFLGTFVVIPFGQFLIIADLNVGLLYLMAITGFVALGLMMAGWSSNNKWSLLGGMRSSAQIISYEIPTGLALMVPVILAGTLSTHGIVEGQGGLPWEWYLFNNPLAALCFIIYFISALAEGNRLPFDLPEAESELVAGYNIEYSGWRFAVFFLSEWGNLFVIGAIAATVFLGGWQIPFVSLDTHASHWAWPILGLMIFFAKSMALVFVIIWIRWTLPRFRVDQMMSLCWKYFVPWSFVAIIGTAAYVWLAPGWLQLASQIGTFVVGGLGMTYIFFSRVFYNWEKNPEKKYNWNPFL